MNAISLAETLRQQFILANGGQPLTREQLETVAIAADYEAEDSKTKKQIRAKLRRRGINVSEQ